MLDSLGLDPSQIKGIVIVFLSLFLFVALLVDSRETTKIEKEKK